MKPDISVFLLAYNEEENIGEVLDDSLSVLSRVAGEFEVIVVLYEGSTDDTRKIVKEYAKKDKRVRLVIQKKSEPGYGAAMRVGYESSGYPLVFYTDADRQFDVNELDKLLQYIKSADLVVGYRAKRMDPAGRILAAKTYNLLVRLFFGLKVKDVDCAFKLVRKEVFDKVSLSYGTGISDAELLVKAKKYGFRIVEVPVSHRPRVAGKTVFHEGGLGFVKPSVVINLLRDMIKLKRELKSIG